MVHGIRFNFLKYRYIAAMVSIAFFAVAISSYFYKMHERGYAFTYSIDFTGGTQVLFKFSTPVGSEQVKSAIEQAGWPGAITREFSSTEVLVRVKEVATDMQGLGVRLQEALQKALPKSSIEILQSETVGEGVGAELRWNATRAVLVALIAMLIYIAVTFWSFSFAFGAVIALFHDPLFVLGGFLLLDREISVIFIAALLAVIGYSINDTIVIFSQIRNNLRKMQDVPLADVVNLSLNQTFRRTMLTSFSTVLTVLSLYLLGGEVLRDFSLALLIGMVVGTYSSMYVASPIMMLFLKKDKLS